jgi:large subunit ribosomal protein L18
MALTSKQHTTDVRRKIRTRAKLTTNTSIPRLSVHRTLRHIYAQVIDDASGKTLAAAHDFTLTTGTKSEIATKVGETIAELAKEQKVSKVRFDRGSHKYHGRIAALAEGARSKGLQF